jgi:uncharacterized protein (DUF433 family)
VDVRVVDSRLHQGENSWNISLPAAVLLYPRPLPALCGWGPRGQCGMIRVAREAMSDVQWRDRIVSDPAICRGSACIKGTQVLVSVVLDNLAAGETPEQIPAAYQIAPEDVQAALLYGAELAKNASPRSP